MADISLEAAMLVCLDQAIELAGDVGDYRPLRDYAKRVATEARIGWELEPYRRDMLRICDRATLVADVAQDLIEV